MADKMRKQTDSSSASDIPATDLLGIFTQMFTIRRWRWRSFALLSTTVLLGLWTWNRDTSPITSAVSCKNEIAKIVFPKEDDRLEYVSELGDDPRSIEENFFRFVSTQTQQCFDQAHIGPSEEGGWEVCLYGGLDIRPPCLVYSFGVGNDFRFEKGIEDLLGCEVHSFDPSMGVESHRYSTLGSFHNLGIDRFDGLVGEWKVRRLETIMEELGHKGRTIDYVKMDVEFSEWLALHDWISSGMIHQIRQLALEVHTPEVDIHLHPDSPCTWGNDDSMAFLLKTVYGLKEAGFNVFYSRTNYRTKFISRVTGIERYCCHNVHMINSKHQRNQGGPPKRPKFGL